MRAVRQLSEEAGVYVAVRKFQIINTVGAVSLGARLDCDSMAATHTFSAHYDRQSFVGLAWRPDNESCCCEIYSTGRANLPCANPTAHTPVLACSLWVHGWLCMQSVGFEYSMRSRLCMQSVGFEYMGWGKAMPLVGKSNALGGEKQCPWWGKAMSSTRAGDRRGSATSCTALAA
jgi:hypothetical protein